MPNTIGVANSNGQSFVLSNASYVVLHLNFTFFADAKLPDARVLSSLISQNRVEDLCTEEELKLLTSDESSSRKRKKAGEVVSKTPRAKKASSEQSKIPVAISESEAVGANRRSNTPETSSGAAVNNDKGSTATVPNTVPALVCNDPRVHYPRQLIKAFNSCDPDALLETLNRLCEPGVLGIYRYDGIQNPHGSNYRECDGIEANYTLWSTLFRSAPDFIFRLLDLNFSVDDHCIVSCAFDMHGTRIRDIKHVHEPGDTSSAQSSQPTSRADSPQIHLTADTDLDALSRDDLLHLSDMTPAVVDLLCLYEIEDFMRDSGFDVVSDTSSSNAVPSTHNKSIFSPYPQESISRITKGIKLVVDNQPLRERVRLMFAGTFLVHINTAYKVTKFEFVYKERNA